MDTLDIAIKYLLSICNGILDLLKSLYAYQNYVIAALVILLLAYIFIRLKRHFSPIKLFDNNNGVVSLKKKALYNLVESVCYNMGSLNRPKMKIWVQRRRLYVDVSLKIESSQRLVDFTSKLQDELQIAFIEQLGIEKVGKINVNINEFRGLLKKPLSFYQKTADSKPAPSTPAPTSPLSTPISPSAETKDISAADSEI